MKVFLAHSEKDRNDTQKIINLLNKNNVKYIQNIGNNWNEIFQKITRSQYSIILFSKNFMNDERSLFSIAIDILDDPDNLKRNKFIVKLDDYPVPSFFQHLQVQQNIKLIIKKMKNSSNFININNTNLICPNCFSNIDNQNICVNCNFNTATRNKKDSLPEYSLLSKKYLTGSMFNEDSSSLWYKGMNIHTQHKVCIKEFFLFKYSERSYNSVNIKPKTGFEKQFRSSYNNYKRSIKRTNHISRLTEYFPSIIDTIEENNTIYLIYSQYAGESLQSILTNNKVISESYVFKLVKNIIKACQILDNEKCKIIHGNINPKSIFLESGNPDKLQLGNLEYSYIFENKQNLENFIYNIKEYLSDHLKNRFEKFKNKNVGRYGYLSEDEDFFKSPEVYKQSNICAASDVYSIGAVAYYCLTGKPPPDVKNRIENDKYISVRELRPMLNVTFSDIIDMCLDLKPTNRPSSPNELKKLIDRISEISNEKPKTEKNLIFINKDIKKYLPRIKILLFGLFISCLLFSLYYSSNMIDIQPNIPNKNQIKNVSMSIKDMNISLQCKNNSLIDNRNNFIWKLISNAPTSPRRFNWRDKKKYLEWHLPDIKELRRLANSENLKECFNKLNWKYEENIPFLSRNNFKNDDFILQFRTLNFKTKSIVNIFEEEEVYILLVRKNTEIK